MPNPVQSVVSAIKRGDRKTILIGAGVVGGGVGLIVFLRNRSGGGTVGALPNPQSSLGDLSGGGGGGGGGGGSSPLDLSGSTGGGDLSGLGLSGGDSGIALPTLGDAAIPSNLFDTTTPSNLAETSPVGIGDLPSLLNTAAPIMGGAGFSLPELPQPVSYAGADYGSFSTLPDLPTIGGAGGISQPIIAQQPTQPAIQNTDSTLTNNPLASVKGRLDMNAAMTALASKLGAPITSGPELAALNRQLAPIVQNMQIQQAKDWAATQKPTQNTPAQLAALNKQFAPIVQAIQPKVQAPVSNLATYQGIVQNLARSNLSVYVSPQQFASIGAPITGGAQLAALQQQFAPIVQQMQINQAKQWAAQQQPTRNSPAELAALSQQLAKFVPQQSVAQNSRLSQQRKYGG